ncbi:DUF6349 family protein [Microbacterium amylolyticum]|uniref:DUF6349 family protein n=1 Tax=Microbacterium amylolyticum TaxID=936337 RepID=UPI003623070C
MDLMTAIDQLMIEADLDALPVWEGLPLHFTSGYIDPDEAMAALRRREEEHLDKRGSLRATHMWFPSATGGRLDLPEHDLFQFTADLRCDFWRHVDQDGNRLACLCVGGLLTMTICTRCRWHHIDSDENIAVEAWHDHAFAGWRELPILPGNLRGAWEVER